ncbi:MAG: GatB/YqeY domain-containing protein, partial [Chloroflexi bacterium]|nr:GatB/YqeY domain-containing protein [Chloroflexota bacterium]
MPSLLERLNDDLKAAMRAGETVRRDEIRGLIAMLKAEQQTKLTRSLARQGLILHGDNAELTPEQQGAIDQVRATTGLDDDEAQAVLLQRVKQHRQSIDAFTQGKRADLLSVEEAQLSIDESYLPQQLDAAAVEDAVQTAIRESGASGPRDQGKVMGLLSPRLRGRADMKAVAARVQAVLA